VTSSSRTRSARLLGAGAVVSCLALGAFGALPAQAGVLPEPPPAVPLPGAPSPAPAPGGESPVPAVPLPEPLPDVPLPPAPGGGGSVAAAAAAEPTVVAEPGKTTLSIDVLVGPDDDTACTIDADYYLPEDTEGDDAPPPPYPAILTTNGFGGSKSDQADLALALNDRGYAVLSYTGLGFPQSTCDVYLDDRQFDGKAASQLVDFLAGQETDAFLATDDETPGPSEPVTRVTTDAVATEAPGDPLVGMVGGSYGGQVQFAAAAVDDRIDTLVPLITWNDLQYSLAPNNTSFTDGVTHSTPGAAKVGWSSLFFGVGIADGLEGTARGDYPTPDDEACEAIANFRGDACTAQAHLVGAGYPDQNAIDLTRAVSVSSYLDQIDVPVLLIQGQNDTLFNLQEAVATYEGLQDQGTEVQMIWQSWGHSGDATPAAGELSFDSDEIEGTYLGGRVLDWFDHYLKPGSTAPTGPEFAYFRQWTFDETGDAVPAYQAADAYPVGDEQQLYLSGDGALVPDAGAVTDGSVQWVNPALGAPTSFSEASGLEGAGAPVGEVEPFDVPGTFGAWTSAPLATDLDIVGVPELEVEFTSPVVAGTQAMGPEGQLLVFAKLYDVAPDGSVTLVNRLISPTRVPDVTQPVTIELPGIVHRVEAGHRLQLVLASTDAAYRNNEASQPVSVDSVAASDHFVLTLPATSALAVQPPGDETDAGSTTPPSSGAQGSDSDVLQSASRRPFFLPRTGLELAGLLGAGVVLAGGGYVLVRRSGAA